MAAHDRRAAMDAERLDRQLLIDGWDQSALDDAKIALAADSDLMASIFIMSAAALGINFITALSPGLDERLIRAARSLNPRLTLVSLRGLYTHPALDDIFSGASLIVDLSRTGLTNKLILNMGFRENIPVVRGFCFRENSSEGFGVFTYVRGREWEEVSRVVSPRNLPGHSIDDGVFSMIAAGIVLEEAKNVLMSQKSSPELITLQRAELSKAKYTPDVGVIGAGALGNFVGLGLALSGIRDITFMDPEEVEATNLNRQVLFYDAVGSSKAQTLALRLNELFGARAGARVEVFGRETDISRHDVIFDCVDNFETRIVLSEKCRDEGKMLISGGTSAGAGQAVVFLPKESPQTPAELLGLYELVEARETEEDQTRGESCVYRPDPSVIMPNQIIAGLMVDSLRVHACGGKPQNVFYDSNSAKKF